MPLRVFFGFLLLAKQKKETRLSSENDKHHLQLPLKFRPFVITNFRIISTMLNY